MAISAPSSTDLTTAAAAAALEVLAVSAYDAVGAAAASGAVGEVPAAVGEFVGAARTHHQAALDAWNEILTANGQAAVSAPPADLAATTQESLAAVTDVAAAAQLALGLEQVAAATYLAAIGTLQAPPAITLAGSIQAVTRQRVAVLLFVLGQYPVPETFATADQSALGGGAATPTSEAATTGPAASASAVRIFDFNFDPPMLSVPVGTTVEWTNDDPFEHSVVSDDGSFESPTMAAEAVFSYQFTAAGTFGYICGFHPSMVATIEVTG